MRQSGVGVAAGNTDRAACGSAFIDARGALRDLNLQFLGLLATPANWIGGGCAGLSSDVLERLASLSDSQRSAAARCPYALFDVRLDDDRHWRCALEAVDAWRIADEPCLATAREDAASPSAARSSASGAADRLMQLLLFYAWTVAGSAHPVERALLGMSNVTASLLRDTPLHRLPAVAAREAPHLAARWNGRRRFWLALIGAAGAADDAALRHVQLLGLQLAAAARLP